MDIREIGIGGAVIIGGAVYGFSQFGLNDVLSEELKYISEVFQAEKPAYMETVTTEFQNNFNEYNIQMETYLYLGTSKFSSLPKRGTFVETVSSTSPVPKEEVGNLRKLLSEPDFKDAFCEQDEMSMFTEKGWSYNFMVKDANGRHISDINCSAKLIPGVA